MRTVYGSELSRVEYEFTFRRENAGFVEYTGKASFILNPSPFLKSFRREIYMLPPNVPMPPEKEPIQVEVGRVEKRLVSTRDGFSWLVIKHVADWKPVDIREILSRGRYRFGSIEVRHDLYYPEDLLWMLQSPFAGDPLYVKHMGQAMLVFLNSSPPLWRRRGGVLEGAVGRKKEFSVLRFLLDVIPPEVRASRDYHYSLANSEAPPPSSALEANVTYLNPRSVDIHLVLPLRQEFIRVKSRKEYASEVERCAVRAFVIDSLLIRPELKAADHALKAAEEIVDEARSRGVPCPIEFSAVIPKLSASFARVERSFAVEKKHVERAKILYEALYEEGLKIVSDRMRFEALLKLSDAELKVYRALLDLGGREREVALGELSRAAGMPEEKVLLVLQSERLRRLVYEPRPGVFRVISF